jgi:hypothetical protein
VNPNHIVAKVVDALQRCNVPFMIVGSFSSNVYGIERTTQDADFVVQLDPPITDFVRALGPDFRFNPQLGFETVTLTQRYIATHLDPHFTIELFLLSDDPHDRERFSRRRTVQVAARTIVLPTPEDVIITKLRWSRQGNRTKDIEDVRNILAVQQGKLDLSHVRRWCSEHGTLEIFETTLKSIPLLPP